MSEAARTSPKRTYRKIDEQLICHDAIELLLSLPKTTIGKACTALGVSYENYHVYRDRFERRGAPDEQRTQRAIALIREKAGAEVASCLQKHLLEADKSNIYTADWDQQSEPDLPDDSHLSGFLTWKEGLRRKLDAAQKRTVIEYYDGLDEKSKRAFKRKYHFTEQQIRMWRQSLSSASASGTDNVFTHILEFGNDEYFVPRDSGDDFASTNEMAGTIAKLEILADRAKRGLPLWHPENRDGYD